MTEVNRPPLLFKHYPKLKRNLPWRPLGTFPTPVGQLKNLGFDNLWIKRDDLSSPTYGGNKVRKLEFILADVKARHKTHIVTCGGMGTHHGLATTLFGRQEGFKTTVLLFDQPITSQVKQNFSLMANSGTEFVHKKTLFSAMLAFYLLQRVRDPRAYYLYPGGSNVIGTIGYVNAAFELKEQIEQSLLPVPAVIFCPVGSNGTLAGLSLGMLLAGLPTEVIGIRVSTSHLGPFQACTTQKVRSLMTATYRHMQKKGCPLPAISIPVPKIEHAYYGDGYGHPTPAGNLAIRTMRDKEHITLDPTYTAKTFAAVIDHCTRNNQQPVLFWNTYNSIDLSARIESSGTIDRCTIPESLRSLLK